VPRDEAVRDLAGRVYGLTDRNERDAYHILSYAVENGHLRYVQDEERIRWEWNDYL